MAERATELTSTLTLRQIENLRPEEAGAIPVPGATGQR